MRYPPCPCIVVLQALNDLFTKIVQRDVPARYLLRLGAGEQELETEEQFSQIGRVNAMLARRLELLAEVSAENVHRPFTQRHLLLPCNMRIEWNRISLLLCWQWCRWSAWLGC